MVQRSPVVHSRGSRIPAPLPRKCRIWKMRTGRPVPGAAPRSAGPAPRPLRCCRHPPFFQTVVEAVDLRDRLEDRVSVLRRHGIEFPDAALAVHFFGRTQIGVQLVQNGVELLVREGGIHLVGGVHPERKGDRRAAVQLRGPLLYIRGIAELPILREGGIRENVNVSGRGRLGPFVRVERLCCFGPHNRPPWHRRSASQY